MSSASFRSTKSQLLYVGNEPSLSKASCILLKEAGFKVRSTNPSHASDAVRDKHYVAVIFCATLSGMEMDTIAELMESHQPGVPIISMQVGLLGEGAYRTSAAVVDALHGPQALIGAVRSVTLVDQKAS